MAGLLDGDFFVERSYYSTSAHVPLKTAFSRGGSGPHPRGLHGLGPPIHIIHEFTIHPKLAQYQFSHFSTAHHCACAQHTDTQTTLRATSMHGARAMWHKQIKRSS